jgi:dipeptidyl aminopeptidase/acylaminoacyl peptidase
VIQWKSSDGALIEGILIKPADYEPTVSTLSWS